MKGRILSASIKGVQSKLQRTGFFFKFNLNLSLINPSRLSLTLINFFSIPSPSYLLLPNSESHQASTCSHALNSRSLLLTNCWTCLMAAASAESTAFDFVKGFAQETCASYPSTPPCDDRKLFKMEPSHFLV